VRRVTSSWKVIEEVLWEHAHSAYEALRPPARTGDISELEDTIGCRVPAGLAASLRVHDGMTDRTPLIDYMSLLSVKRIAYWWRLSHQSQREDEFGGDNVTRTRKIKNDVRWRDAWIPFMEDLGGDLMVIDLDPGPSGTSGQVFQWYNNGCTPKHVVAPSLPAWLDAVAEELAGRRFTLDELGTINLRRRLT
jgi:cell wall assembly regulator SMI1